VIHTAFWHFVLTGPLSQSFAGYAGVHKNKLLGVVGVVFYRHTAISFSQPAVLGY